MGKPFHHPQSSFYGWSRANGGGADSRNTGSVILYITNRLSFIWSVSRELSVIAMTRVTNFGIKRTHLEAGFSNDDTPSKEIAIEGQSSVGIHDPTVSSEAPPPKKKRKRTPKSKRDGNLAKNATEKRDETRENDSLKGHTEDDPVENGASPPATGKSAKRNKRNKERRNKGKLFPEIPQLIIYMSSGFLLLSDFQF